MYFISQNPADVPEDILGQLGNRVQHALRAFTAKDQKELRLAAQTYRDNPSFSTEEAIREVGVGEAVTSMLQPKGVPGIVERTLIRPPSSQLGPITMAQRHALMAISAMAGKYDTLLDRESAFETLRGRAKDAAAEAEAAEAAIEKAEADAKAAKTAATNTPSLREFKKARGYENKGQTTSRRSADPVGSGIGGAIANVVIKELKGTTGRRIVRGILGGLFKGR